MPMDRFSPVAAAHIRVLVLPVGRIECKSFVEFVRRLQDEAALVHHVDLKTHVGDEDFLLSPKKFERGHLLFNFTASSPHDVLLQLSPYELFREPLLVIGVVEGLEGGAEQRRKELKAAAEYLREKHPRVVHRHLLILQEADDGVTEDLDNAIRVENAYDAGHPALRDAINRLALRFLRELTTYVQAMQASPSIPTPGQTSRALQRTSWLRDADNARSGSASGYGTPRELHSPVEEESPASRPPAHSRNSPATSFDQMPSANTVSALSRTESNRGRNGRAGSQDRVAVQGFGTGTSQDKAKKRGKARVGIVLGSIYMMAGVWNESLQLLVEHTNQARSLQDHLWHAKGLENIVVCLLLHLWAGLDFQIPSICYATDKKSNPAQRFSVSLPADPKPGGATNQVSLQRFSLSIPDIIKQLSALYDSTEGPMELSSQVLCEATIRMTKLLAILHNGSGLLSEAALAQIVESKADPNTARRQMSNNAATIASMQGTNMLSRSAIAEMVNGALPSSEDSFSVADHLTILAGVASVYAILGMDRKKAITMKDLVIRLTLALNQARKIGAAEMGIHPAASLSAENGADALVASIHESEGMINMIADVANIYGVQLIGSGGEDSSKDPAERQKPQFRAKAFGSDSLKFEALRDLLALCEASPDPYGILRLIASFLSSAGPNAAIDSTPEDCGVSMLRDEQAQLASLMNKTIGVSKQLGLTDAQAEYWDPFLLRAVELVPPSALDALVDRSKLRKPTTVASQQEPGNPLLYDPNASRQPTAQQDTILVQEEVSECLLTLQNPYELALDIESLSVVVEGIELSTIPQAIQLGAARLQQIRISIIPKSPGKAKIKGCSIKVAGCREQFFPIVSKPWSPQTLLTLKSIGQEARHQGEDPKHKPSEPEYTTISADVIAQLPSLVLEGTSLLESSLMLLEGEKHSFDVIVRNTSDVEASVLDVVGSTEGLGLLPGSVSSIPPRAAVSLPLELVGQAGVSELRADIIYASASGTDTFARMLSVPLSLTVNAALQAHHLEISPSPTTNSINLSIDLRNAWPKPLSFTCSTLTPGSNKWQSQSEDTLPPGQVRRIYLSLPRWITDLTTPPSPEDLRVQFLARLRISWSTAHRQGTANLATLTLPPDSASTLLGSAIALSLSLPASESLPPGSALTVRVLLHNRAALTSPLSVQLHPRTPSPVIGAAVAGPLQHIVPPLQPGESKQVDFALWVLCKGKLHLRASVRPALTSGGKEEAVSPELSVSVG